MKISKVFVLVFLYLFPSLIFAQVGINTESPNSLTELDIHNIVNGTDTIPKGIMIPRLTESLRNQIDVSSDQSKGDGLLIYNIDENCFNYYNRSNAEWLSLCGREGKALFDPIDCSNITIHGEHIQNEATNTSNYLSIDVVVTKPGVYSINAISGNGYSYSVTGTAPEKGPITIKVPAQGKPVTAGKDILSITGLPFVGVTNCSPEVTVIEPTATYSINCSSITVNGNYRKKTELNTSNTIVLTVNVATPGSYLITTPVTNGISFSASGFLTADRVQTITLQGQGTPTVNYDIPITITTNSTLGNSTCSTTIPIILPAMTYAIIGTSTWSWADPSRIAALSGSNNFGLNGKVKMEGLSQLWSTADIATATTNLNNGLNGQKPDIVLYFAYGAAPTQTITDALIHYINNGGCVIYGSSDGTSAQVNTLLTGVFGVGNAQQQIAGSGTVDDNTYPITNLPNDPVISGPFGYLGGKYWGEDNSSNLSVIVTKLPPNSVQVASANNQFGKTTVNPDYSIIWYNEKKNFMYFGDSVGAATNNSGQNDYPSSFSSSGEPQSKLYGNFPLSSSSQFCFNAALELNAVAWAIRKAVINGINPH